jgi:hypothetical protein
MSFSGSVMLDAVYTEGQRVQFGHVVTANGKVDVSEGAHRVCVRATWGQLAGHPVPRDRKTPRGRTGYPSAACGRSM